MLWEKILPVFFIAPLLIYGISLENKRRGNIAQDIAKDWLQTNYTGCYIRSMESSKWSWPVVVTTKVYTSKNEDFDIKLKVGSSLAGIFNDKIRIVYIRKIKPT
ncbi:hypothetical protein CXB49_10930 [Chromobacterium sp. ATCC 53434]|uniref:hypothetical protein n=1 Tax=Chromobacterium sp. (strain ATCC 53434 / SC 14030) TaxID=2059672 RepID=UPI000C772575|nr:hypothetical protein [Chromobacterium sp. ATCC 53434]AUH51290.1 hypothetical protein CXB49_10930 [Chromobacterium sp. ATCC 53434]